MKIYYFNDEHIPIRIQVNSVQRDINDLDFIRYEEIQPCEGRMIEFEAPEDAIPYLKRWESRQVLLTYLRVEVADRLNHRDEQGDGKS